eukprot:14292-Eustigmatos_ZCMA.PRE.1
MVPLAAEDTVDPRSNIPGGVPYGIAYVIALTAITVVVGSAMPPGLDQLHRERFPLTPGLQA